MGTTGLYVFIYKNKCYVFYNQMDSYPEILGQILITMIKTENYKKWGELLIDKIDNKNYKIRKLKYEFNGYIDVAIHENEKLDIMEEDEWIKSVHKYDGTSYMYLKWNFYDLIEHCEITKGMIKNFCPSLKSSTFINSFNMNEETYIKEIYKLNNADWVYIIDLDMEELKVLLSKNEIIKFPLNNIPYNWLNKIKVEYEN